MRLTIRFLEEEPAIRLLLEQAALTEPGIDIDGWMAQFVAGRGYVDPPYSTEDGQATVVWRLMKRIGSDDRFFQQARMVGGQRNHNEWASEFTSEYVSPLFDYLAERLGGQSAIAYVLGRYIRQLEWFDREPLFAEFETAGREGEAVYDRHLRRFLFSEGVDMPYSQARSPSGESDALAALETDDPLVCELKVFDGANRDKARVAGGVNQALQYAHDYRKTSAYLVVVDVSGRPLEFPTDGPANLWPPYVDVAGVRVFLVGARGFRLASASKLGTAQPVIFTRDDLIRPDVPG